MDVYAWLDHAIDLRPGELARVPTGFCMQLETGFEAQLRPRSSQAPKGITLPNSPATLDAGYRGEIVVVVQNLGPDLYTIRPGDRIAQMVINQLPQVGILEVEELDESARGTRGFGSTGV